jgi:hypothetical protein
MVKNWFWSTLGVQLSQIDAKSFNKLCKYYIMWAPTNIVEMGASSIYVKYLVDWKQKDKKYTYYTQSV